MVFISVDSKARGAKLTFFSFGRYYFLTCTPCGTIIFSSIFFLYVCLCVCVCVCMCVCEVAVCVRWVRWLCGIVTQGLRS